MDMFSAKNQPVSCLRRFKEIIALWLSFQSFYISTNANVTVEPWALPTTDGSAVDVASVSENTVETVGLDNRSVYDGIRELYFSFDLKNCVHLDSY